MTLTVTGGSESEKTYKFGYTDSGPSFANRVNGKKYTGGATYEFQNEGKTLVYNGTSYTYDSTSDTFNSDGEIQAKYGGYWYTLSNNDQEISYWRSYAEPKLFVATLVKQD